MEFEREEDEVVALVSPTGQYLASSVLSLTILAVLELEGPVIDYSRILSFIKDALPINPRFSSIMVEENKGVKKWKRVEVKLNDHIIVPIFPQGMSLDFYDERLNEYLSKIAIDPLPQSKPLWQIHLIKYPTNNAHGNLIFKIHHALGDGYSLIGALLSCLQRVDNPSLPLTFPSRQSNSRSNDVGGGGRFDHVTKVFSGFFNTMLDFGWSFMKSSVMEDDISPIRSGNMGVEFRPMTTTTMSLSLDHIKQIKAKLGVTINDVINGAVLYGIRKYMEGKSNESRKANSTALVLLNTRSLGGYQSVSEMIKPNAKMPWGNQFAFLHVPIPKLLNGPHDNSSNPIDFVFNVHKMVKKKKNSAAVHLNGRLLETLRKFRGPEASAKYIHSTLENSSMCITNLIGPVEQMAMANHPVRGLYFFVAGSPQSLVTTVISYMGKVWICIGMEKGFMDSYKLKACIQDAFDMLFKATV